MDKIRAHIRKHLDTHQITQRQLEDQAGLSRSLLAKVMRSRPMAQATYFALHRVVHFGPEHEAELIASSTKAQNNRAKAANRARANSALGQLRDTAQPWTETVRKFKQQPPLYLRAW